MTLFSCNHDKETSENIQVTYFNISGKVNIPGLSAETISISTLDLQNVLSSSSMESTEGENITSFQISNVELLDNELYVLKVCNGTGEVIDRKGQLAKVDNSGCLYSLGNKEYFTGDDVGINIFSDIFYWRIQGLSSDEVDEAITNVLKQFSNANLTDTPLEINDLFQLNEEGTYNFNYTSFKNSYLTNVYRGVDYLTRVEQSIDILPVNITVKGGNIHTTPTELEIELEGLPHKAQYSLSLNGERLNGNIISLENAGTYTVEATIMIASKSITTISTEILLTNSSTVQKVLASADSETLMSLNFEQSSNFVGTEVTIPASQSVEGLYFEFQDVDSNTIPNAFGASYSGVFKMLPENILFDEPVTVKLMLDPSLTDQQIQETIITRYSEVHGLEYIQPFAFDYREKAAFFETEHFSYFSASGPFKEKSKEMRQLEIDYLKEITGDYWYEEKLEQVLAPNDIEMSIYDYFDQLHKSKLINEYVEEDDYVSAVKVL
jgi:hypothetical protein